METEKVIKVKEEMARLEIDYQDKIRRVRGEYEGYKLDVKKEI